MLRFVKGFLALGACLVVEGVGDGDLDPGQVVDQLPVLFLDGEDALAALNALLVEQFVLPLVEFLLELEEDLTAELRVTHVLGHLSELDETFDLLLLVFYETADVEQLLVDFEVLGWHRFLPLDPTVEEVGALFRRVRRLVFDHFFELFEELELLDGGVGPIVRLVEQRSNLGVKDLSCVVDLDHCALVVFHFDQVDS